jgi:hypothetical protein
MFSLWLFCIDCWLLIFSEHWYYHELIHTKFRFESICRWILFSIFHMSLSLCKHWPYANKWVFTRKINEYDLLLFFYVNIIHVQYQISTVHCCVNFTFIYRMSNTLMTLSWFSLVDTSHVLSEHFCLKQSSYHILVFVSNSFDAFLWNNKLDMNGTTLVDRLLMFHSLHLFKPISCRVSFEFRDKSVNSGRLRSPTRDYTSLFMF